MAAGKRDDAQEVKRLASIAGLASCKAYRVSARQKVRNNRTLYRLNIGSWKERLFRDTLIGDYQLCIYHPTVLQQQGHFF